MELNLKIKNLGKIDEIFSFYKYLLKRDDFSNCALLESIEEGVDSNPAMLFSFIALKPDFMVKAQGSQLTFYDIQTEKGEKIKAYCESHEIEPPKIEMPFEDTVPMEFPALDALKKLFPVSKAAMPELFPRKIFSGGLLGYLGYDIVAPYVGYTPKTEARELFPDAIMGLFTNVMAYSHTTKALYHIENSIDEQETADNNNDFAEIVEKFKAQLTDIKKTPRKSNKASGNTIAEQNPINFKSNTNESQWASMIDITKEHIMAGDIIQAVLSRKVYVDLKVTPLEVYQTLRQVNPSPYMFHLQFKKAHNGDINLLGSSPEALVSKNQTHLNTVPIAGTRRRGKTPEDEAKMEKELLSDEKEMAEHIMLVDLARNDLARVSMPGTVNAYELLKLRKYPSVMHLVSKVESKSYLDAFSVLKSMFPAGTVSGSPKKRAMEIIHQQETEERGPYAGCVGYISFTGDMDMAITIRTIFNKNQRYIAQAGAGIVADSKSELEFLETSNKIRGTLRALEGVQSSCRGK